MTLGAGANALLDADGSAIVIHAGPDDNKTDPAGNSGARIACGQIVAMQSALPTTGGTPMTWLLVGVGVLVALGGLVFRRRWAS